MGKRPWVKQAILAGVVLAVCLGFSALLIYMPSQQAQAKPAKPLTLLVEAHTLNASLHQQEAQAFGRTSSPKTLRLHSSLGGVLSHVHKELEKGGIVKRKSRLVSFDTKELRLRIKRQRLQVRRALASYKERKGQRQRRQESLARLEAAEFGAPGQVVSADAQTKLARIDVSDARVAMEQTKLMSKKTKIKAPFDAMVMRADLDVGQFVEPGALLMELASVESFTLRVNVPLHALSWMNLNLKRAGVPYEHLHVEIQQTHQNQTFTRTASIKRLLGAVDQEHNTAQVLLEVFDPLWLRTAPPTASHPPLLLGEHVKVSIKETQPTKALLLPRRALRRSNKVYVVTPQNTLSLRDVVIGQRHKDFLEVKEGLSSGERVIISPVDLPIEGMPVNLLTEVSASPDDT